MISGSALVLGGGGIGGAAWMTGVLAGLADSGIDVTVDAGHLIGTSAGASVAAQIGSGLPLADLLARQTDPALQASELVASGLTLGELSDIWRDIALEHRNDQPAIRRALGELALTVDDSRAAERLAAIAARLPSRAWPERPLTVTAIDAHTGDPRFFTSASGVPLVDAVAASCAVPGIWPTVPVGGDRCFDGGIRSGTNADLAVGASRVLILAPMGPHWPLRRELAAITEAGGRALVITPDAASERAFTSRPLDPATRTPAANSGHTQGTSEAEAVRALHQA